MSGLVNVRLKDFKRFFALLAHLESNNGIKSIVGLCNGNMNCPKQGVYISFEGGEFRTESDEDCQIPR